MSYAVATSYTITVQASDAYGMVSQPASFTILVTKANPTQPSDMYPTPATVIEGAAGGTPVGITVESTNPGGEPITYRLTDSAGGLFVINGTTGVVTVAPGAMISYATAQSYTIDVQATDAYGGASAVSPFTISVLKANPSAPMDVDPRANSVQEFVANGTQVGITAQSTNLGGEVLVYTLTNNAGGRFAIEPATGVITVANGALLSYAAATSYTVTVQAQDNYGGISAPTTFTIEITKGKPSRPSIWPVDQQAVFWRRQPPARLSISRRIPPTPSRTRSPIRSPTTLAGGSPSIRRPGWSRSPTAA